MTKTKIKRIIRTIILIFCGLFLGLNIYHMNAKNLLGNEFPMPFGFGSAVVLSGSMEPKLSVGDLIIIKEPNELKKDDIIVFKDNSSNIVHRIIEINGDDLTTKGDANLIADAPINLKNVKGKVVFNIPLIGYLINFLKTPIGIVLTIVIAFGLLETSNKEEKQKNDIEIDKIRKEIEELKNNLK